MLPVPPLHTHSLSGCCHTPRRVPSVTFGFVRPGLLFGHPGLLQLQPPLEACWVWLGSQQSTVSAALVLPYGSTWVVAYALPAAVPAVWISHMWPVAQPAAVIRPAPSTGVQAVARQYRPVFGVLLLCQGPVVVHSWCDGVVIWQYGFFLLYAFTVGCGCFWSVSMRQGCCPYVVCTCAAAAVVIVGVAAVCSDFVCHVQLHGERELLCPSLLSTCEAGHLLVWQQLSTLERCCCSLVQACSWV